MVQISNKQFKAATIGGQDKIRAYLHIRFIPKPLSEQHDNLNIKLGFFFIDSMPESVCPRRIGGGIE